MPHNSAFAGQAACDLGRFVGRALQCLRPGAVPEPDAGVSVLGEMKRFHKPALNNSVEP